MAKPSFHPQTVWRLSAVLVGFILALGAYVVAASTKGLYVGNDFYAPSPAAQGAARLSGFTRLFLFALHINEGGDISYNNIVVVRNGVYVGDPTWASRLAALKVKPTSIERIEMVVGGRDEVSMSTFANVKRIAASQGAGTNGILYRNFEALKNATGIDAIQLDDEQEYDGKSAVMLGKMIAGLGLKVALRPYTNQDFWVQVKSQLGTNVDAIYLQCYGDGAGNDLGRWIGGFNGFPVIPVLWGNSDTPARVSAKLRRWQNSLGVTGGIIWLNGSMPDDAPKWEQALAIGLDSFPTFRIVNKNSGKSLGIISGSLTNGTIVNQSHYSMDGSQQWSILPTENGSHYKLISWESGKCVSIYNDSRSPGALVWLWDYNADTGQQFDLVDAENGCFKIRNVRSGLVLEVSGGSMANNAIVHQNMDTGAASQQWELYPYGDAILAYDNFDYPPGDLSRQSGGAGWNGGWLDDSGSMTKVSAGSLTAGTNAPDGYDPRSSGNFAFVPTDDRVGRYLDCLPNGLFGVYGYLDANGRVGADGTTLYISFLQQPSVPSLFYEFEFHRGNVADLSRIAGIGNDTRTNNVNLRTQIRQFTRIGPGDTNVNLYVMRIDFKNGNDDVRVYRNPVSATEPAMPTLSVMGAADMSFDRICLAAFANKNTVKHDQIRIATSWPCALGDVPDSLVQPASNLVSADSLRKVRLSAQVLCSAAQKYYLLDGNTGIRAHLSRSLMLEPGDVVELVGLVQPQQHLVEVFQAVARKTGHLPLPPAQPLTASNSQPNAYWVSTEGLLTGLTDRGADRKLTIQIGLKSYEALLCFSDPLPGNWPLGSRVKLTGVYMHPDTNQMENPAANSFKLLLNSPAAIEIVARPPWWTFKRVMLVIGLLVAVLVLAMVWISLLRRQVEQHAVRLKREITERELADRGRIIEAERARISRDLHDDLGSILTQINMLSNFSIGTNVTPESSRERMQSIADKSHQLISALDEVVWMMNPKDETPSSLLAYIAAYAEEFASKTNIICRIEAPKSYPETVITAEARNNLFSSVKEAVNNAVRHGRPKQILVRFLVGNGKLTIQIQDDGAGFDTLEIKRGDGLANMQNRMQKLNGACHVESFLRGGTKVTLELPLDHAGPPGISDTRDC